MRPTLKNINIAIWRSGTICKLPGHDQSYDRTHHIAPHHWLVLSNEQDFRVVHLILTASEVTMAYISTNWGRTINYGIE
jgi:hypothetical protein